MKEYTQSELKSIYEKRRKILADFLTENEIGACVFIDDESHRDPNLFYYSAFSSDAVLIIYNTGYSILIPWDENLAKKNAICNKIIPFTRYSNDKYNALKSVLTTNRSKAKFEKTELPPYLTYIEYLKFLDKLNNFTCRCTEYGAHKFVTECRMIKDNYEIECIKEACRIGDLILDEIEKQIHNAQIKTETDVALLIEKMLRENDCQKTGFDTLAAGPLRSFAIHAFPGYTAQPWPSQGLSILDFGVVYNGYTSDMTVTVAKGPLSPEQEKQLNLVQKVYDECSKLYAPEKSIANAAKTAEIIFASEKRKMPHTLGHAIGLEIHEYPRVSTKTDSSLLFKPGMILTCEPGLYDDKTGGCRLENDILITKTGNEILTHSRIIRI